LGWGCCFGWLLWIFCRFCGGGGGVGVGPLWVSLSFCVNSTAFYLLSFVVGLVSILQTKYSPFETFKSI